MKTSFRLILTCALSFSLAPNALAAPDRKTAAIEEASEQLNQIYDVLRPARRDETLAEAYYRAVVFIDADEQRQLEAYLDGHAGVKTPQVEKAGDTLVIRSGKSEARLQVRAVGGEVELRLNGQLITEKELSSASLRWKKIEKILGASARAQNGKASLWWIVGVPPAEAGLSDIFGSISTAGWITIGGAVAIAGVMLYKYYSNKKESKKRRIAAATPQCTDPTPSCCNYNGSLISHTTGCCQQIAVGALRQSTGACPTTTSTTSGATVSPVTTSGQQ
ncbi:MAG: hypothetical protein KF865_00020 [Bdellovibrionaceae bacterium]|nr:hypothetical protein [Pseudobdellovibrionaceae bacterium]